jgi:hypothetical protein
MRRASLAILLILGCALHAQDDALDIAVAFPATTMVYLYMDDVRLAENFNFNELMLTLGGSEAATTQQQFMDRLGLEFAEGELEALMQGFKRSTFGLLDVTVSGPRLQVVIEHADLKPLSRALKAAHARSATSVPEVKDHFGTPIYSIFLAQEPTTTEPGGFRMSNPLEDWLNQETMYAAIVADRFLVIANGYTAVADAVDFLAFPEDTVDTLLSSARYREAVRAFDDPHGLLYVSIESIITAVERLSGDQGGSPMLPLFFPFFFEEPESLGFFVRLLQYEQFRSASAAMWFDGPASQVRVDFGFSFHNAPGWFEAVRVPPGRRPFEDLIPADAAFVITECAKDRAALYERVKQFVFERARNAGQQSIIESWETWEANTFNEGVSVNELLGFMGGGQALIILPRPEDDIDFFNPAYLAWLVELDDLDAAERFLFERLLTTRLGSPLRSSQGALAGVTVHGGVEIHNAGGNTAFALIPRENGRGAFAWGEAPAIKGVVDAIARGSVINQQLTWQRAESLLPETSSVGCYMNIGSLISMLGSTFDSARRFMWWDDDEEDTEFDRDDTERDQNPSTYLSSLLSGTVVSGAAYSEPRAIRYHMVIGGIPGAEHMDRAAIHFRDVARNVQVRDSLLEIREAAFMHYALQDVPPADFEALLAFGYIQEETLVDPYSEDEPYTYQLAEVPTDVDSRQAILLAYQARPGLRGNHLAVLWNSHIVELTPEQLQEAIERARDGKALEEDRYRRPEPQLFTLNLKPERHFFEEPWIEAQPALVIIDDEGNEEFIGLGGDNVREQAEQILDKREAANEED